MIQSIKDQLFQNWHTMRWVALGFGLFLGINWILNSAPISGFLSLFFLFQAVTNSGCMVGQCMPASPYETELRSENREPDFEEIKK
ncbi:MAG: hypothetical protein EA360_01315 [Balneolaceae bacterium]|nr:MAG: hypothetical protein EA360_01315 [Balneolaceae bacterium]